MVLSPLSLSSLLFFFLFPATIAQNASTIGCCGMTQSRLNLVATENPNCTTSFSEPLTAKCSSCPTAGTCRIDNRCICADTFVSSSHRRSQCSNAFGINWPGSIAMEDRDWRSCDPSLTPPPANATSCCAMSESRLQALRGFNPQCPSVSYDFQLAKKCDPCPSGLCRLNDKCICPDQFLDRTSLQTKCAVSFAASWPQSVGKEDRATRSCRGVTPPKSARLSCCSLTEKQLNEMLGTSDRCPTSKTVRLSNVCNLCPSGLCRFGRSCYCPTRFLFSSVKDLCEKTFDVAWPESIGKPDPDIVRCGNESNSLPASGEPSTSSPTVTNDSSNSESDLPSSTGLSDPAADTNAPAVVNSEERLTTLEIVGIAAGVVSAVVAVLAAGVGFTRQRRHRNQEVLTVNEHAG